jgi:two-component system, OmpR family, KDP operon response regulator KdpE
MAGKRILIVEDDPSMRKVLHARLKTEGFDAVPMADAVTAFAEIRKQPPDLILLDLGLPGGGGLNLMARLQSIPKHSLIPIIVLSARERSSGIEAEVLEKGASAFFQKPTEPEVLIGKIRELLGEPQR